MAIELGVVVGDKINIMSSSLFLHLLGTITKQSTFKIAAVFLVVVYMNLIKVITFFTLNDSLSFFEKSIEDINLEFFLNNPMKANNLKK